MTAVTIGLDSQVEPFYLHALEEGVQFCGFVSCPSERLIPLRGRDNFDSIHWTKPVSQELGLSTQAEKRDLNWGVGAT